MAAEKRRAVAANVALPWIEQGRRPRQVRCDAIDIPPEQSDVRGLAWAGIDVPDDLDPGHL